MWIKGKDLLGRNVADDLPNKIHVTTVNYHLLWTLQGHLDKEKYPHTGLPSPQPEQYPSVAHLVCSKPNTGFYLQKFGVIFGLCIRFTENQNNIIMMMMILIIQITVRRIQEQLAYQQASISHTRVKVSASKCLNQLPFREEEYKKPLKLCLLIWNLSKNQKF